MHTRRALLTIAAICLIALTVKRLVAPTEHVKGANVQLQFSADKDHFYFFDPADEKVYTYSVAGGHVQNALQLSKPGGELKPVPTY